MTPESFIRNAIPVIVDSDKRIREGHAIMIYLAEAYGKSDDLYPKDHYIRAKINAIMFFESGIFASKMRFIFVSIVTLN